MTKRVQKSCPFFVLVTLRTVSNPQNVPNHEDNQLKPRSDRENHYAIAALKWTPI